MVRKEPEAHEGEVSENAVLAYGTALYAPNTQKIAPPLPSSRRRMSF